MELIDISLPIHEGMTSYPGDPPVRVERVAELAAGDEFELSRLELGSHTGTHVDAPAHFLRGAAGVDELPLDAFVGPAEVVDARAAGRLDRTTLEALGLPLTARLLLRTRDRGLTGPDASELTGDGAALLVERGVRLVGIDGLSIGDAEAHRTLLRAGVVPVEGLDLRAVEPGSYRLVCLPLRLAGADGAPARALLIRD